MTARRSGGPNGGFRRGLTLLAVPLLCALPNLAVARTIGPDDRIVLPAARTADFSGVGKIICVNPATRVRVHTTMTIVGDRRTVIGAGHFRRTVVDGRVEEIPLEDCQFELYGADLKTRFVSGIAQISGTGRQQALKPNPYLPDWAVLVLSREAPRSVRPVIIAPLDKQALSRLDDVFMVAHQLGGRFPLEAKVYSPGCKPNAIVKQQRSFIHLCDTDRGSSGALLFSDGPDGPRAIGINIAQSSAGSRNYGQLFQPKALALLPEAAIDRTWGDRDAK